jgi:hypothetical protein
MDRFSVHGQTGNKTARKRFIVRVFFDDLSLHDACYYLIKRKKVVVCFSSAWSVIRNLFDRIESRTSSILNITDYPFDATVFPIERSLKHDLF